jgi:hypothetical protein
MATKAASKDISQALGMAYLTVRMTGTTPLLQSNVRMANPLDPMVKAKREISGKTKKTDADHERMAEIEWEGALYIDDELGPYVPAEWVWRSVQGGARLSRGGKSVERGLLIDPTNRLIPIEYDGPRDLEGLRADPDFRHYAMVNANPSSAKITRTVRCRPKFDEWAVEARFLFNDTQLNEADVRAWAEAAGAMIGMGDGRSIGFGRYTVEVSS